MGQVGEKKRTYSENMLKELPHTTNTSEQPIHNVGNGRHLTQREYDELVVEALGYGPLSRDIQLEQRRREQRSAALHNKQRHR